MIKRTGRAGPIYKPEGTAEHVDGLCRLRCSRIGDNCGALSCRRSGELARRQRVGALEMPSERALIVEPDSGCHIRDGQSLSQSATGGTQPDLGKVGVRRKSHRSPEQADELESREPDVTSELREAEILGVASPHDLDHPVHQGSIPRGRLDERPGDVAPEFIGTMGVIADRKNSRTLHSTP